MSQIGEAKSDEERKVLQTELKIVKLLQSISGGLKTDNDQNSWVTHDRCTNYIKERMIVYLPDVLPYHTTAQQWYGKNDTPVHSRAIIDIVDLC